MKDSYFLTILMFFAMIMTPSNLLAEGAERMLPKKVIFETDMSTDVDDVGALAVLHALADNGEAEILAISFNEVHPSAANAICAINTWYNRGNIPIGVYKGDLADPDESSYLDALANFTHNLPINPTPSSLELYLQVLSEQPDNSVTIISVGFLNNLYDLLKTNPDLITQKVTELVVMAVLIDDPYNTVRHGLINQSEYVIHNWPTPLVISQHGESVHTGARLSETPAENPVQEAFYQRFNGQYKGRSSWDQLAVLYGVRGIGDYFAEITEGKGRLSNGYEWEMKPGFRSYLDPRLSDSEYVHIVEDLMIKPPRR
ncbi:MAG: nucleoside hydrolase [Candidatus Poribacteria bacterium]|nr:nucleoside hydrolase [Candidatus Poribacteria bacterium]